jgi:hypothetical protein
MKVENTSSSCFEWCFDSKTEELKTNLSHNHPKNYYTLRYFYNPNKTFFHLFMHTIVYNKISNENIEKQGILLRSWNPITKRGERYVFRKGEEGDGDLNLKRIHLPNTKTIFKFTKNEDIKKESYKLAEEIIAACPHKDIELKLSID